MVNQSSLWEVFIHHFSPGLETLPVTDTRSLTRLWRGFKMTARLVKFALSQFQLWWWWTYFFLLEPWCYRVHMKHIYFVLGGFEKEAIVWNVLLDCNIIIPFTGADWSSQFRFFINLVTQSDWSFGWKFLTPVAGE